MNKSVMQNNLDLDKKQTFTKAFSNFMLSALGAPIDLGEEAVQAFVDRIKIRCGANKDKSNIYLFQEAEDPEESSPLAVVQIDKIVELMNENSPAVILANKFDGRQYGEVISLDDAILLNTKGYVVIIPQSDDLIHVYGIGTKADSLDDQKLEFGAHFGKERDETAHLIPATEAKYKVIDDEENSLLNAASNTLGRYLGNTVKFSRGKIVTYQDPAMGFIVDVEETSLNYSNFSIYEEGDRYGIGLVIELP